MENKQSAVVRWGLTFVLIMAALGSASDIGARLLEGSLINGSYAPPDAYPPSQPGQ
jgi:hypothetical protein